MCVIAIEIIRTARASGVNIVKRGREDVMRSAVRRFV